MKTYRKFVQALLAMQLFAGCTLDGQDIQVYQIKRAYDYPLPEKKIITIVGRYPHQVRTHPGPADTSRLVPIPSMYANYKYVPLDNQHLLPNDAWLESFYRQGRNYGPCGMLFDFIDADRAVIIFDLDADSDYTEEQPDTLVTGKPVLLVKTITLTHQGADCFLSLPLLIHIFRNEDGSLKRIDVQNLLKYEFRQVIDHDTLAIDINTHNQWINCYYVDPGQRKDSLISFRMKEPFLFKGAWYQLQDLDLCNNTVALVSLNQNQILGYREGHYLDMAILKRLTNEHLLPGAAIDWSAPRYFLLHFWGEWCGPCVAEMPDVQAFESRLHKEVQMVHYPFVFKQNLIGRTLSFIQRNGLSDKQSICLTGDCSGETYEQELCHVAQYMRVSRFPTYILVNREGKILFRGGFSDLKNAADALGLL